MVARIKLLIVSGPLHHNEEQVLDHLPEGVEVVRMCQKVSDLAGLTDAELASINVLLHCGVGADAGKRDDIKEMWPKLTGLVWMHTNWVGLEHLLFPELVSGPVILTNSKGAYSSSLAEFAVMSCKYFAMDMPRLLAAKREKRWLPMDVEELRGRTVGVVGFGEIGRHCGHLCKAHGMRVLALRRHTQLSEQEAAIADRCYAPDEILEMVPCCDYVVVSTPSTPATERLVSAAVVRCMKPNCVLVNVGRGKCVDEEALVAALQEGRIKGAALDVFATEPLPKDSPLWDLDNVIMSAHCADRTPGFQTDTLQIFVRNVERFLQGQPLVNVCDKRSGY